MVSAKALRAPSNLVRGDENIKSAAVYIERSVPQRLDIVPFALLYALAPALVAHRAGDAGAPPWVFASSVAAVGAAHALCLLVCLWSTSVMCFARFKAAATVMGSTHIMVTPHSHRGRATMCVVKKEAPPAEAQEGTKFTVSFSFQHRTYAYDHDATAFQHVQAPVVLPISHFKLSKGLGRPVDAETVHRLYGRNECRIPRRDFVDYLLGQFTAPFFVFQVRLPSTPESPFRASWRTNRAATVAVADPTTGFLLLTVVLGRILVLLDIYACNAGALRMHSSRLAITKCKTTLRNGASSAAGSCVEARTLARGVKHRSTPG